MAFKKTTRFVSKYGKKIAYISGTGTLIGLFAFFVSIGGVITDWDGHPVGDIKCAGTLKEPCIIRLKLEPPPSNWIKFPTYVKNMTFDGNATYKAYDINGKAINLNSLLVNETKYIEIRVYKKMNETVKWTLDAQGGLGIDPLLIGVSEDDIFTKLIDVKGDLTYGTVIYEVTNPLAKTSIPLNSMNSSFEKNQGKAVDRVEYYWANDIYSNVTIEQYKNVYIPKNCTMKANNTNVTYDCSYTEQQYIGNKTDSLLNLSMVNWTPVTKSTMLEGGKKTYIKMIAHWQPKLGNNGKDWIPDIKLNSTITGTVDIDFKQSKWAWLSSSWGMRVPFNVSNIDGNISNAEIILYVNSSKWYANGWLQADCDDYRITYYNRTSDTETQGSLVRTGCTATDTSGLLKDRIFANVSYLHNGTNTTYYLYINNSGATDGNNIAGVFGANLVSFWTFDNGTFTDLMGVNAGTNHGATNDSDYNREVNKSTNVAGGNYIDVGGGATIRTQALTLMSWSNQTAYRAASPYYASIISCENTDYSGYYQAYVGAATNRIESYVEVGASAPYVVGCSISKIWNLNTWNFLVTRYDASTGYFNLSENNNQTCTASDAHAVTYSANTWIGNDPGYTGRYWTGAIDDVRYYNKYLTDTELASINHMKTPRPDFTEGTAENYTEPATPPTVTFNSTVPANVTTTNLFNGFNITYNATDDVAVDNETVYLFYKTNTTTSDSFSVVNGSYRSTNYSSVKMYNISSTAWFITRYDNQIYPATYNFNETYIEATNHTYNLQINSTSQYVRIGLTNLTNNTAYNFFEIMLNNTVSTNNQSTQIYYCNSSYTTGNVNSSGNCTLFYSIQNSNVYNHTHIESVGSYSKHHVAPLIINITTGKVGTVVVTANSSFIIRGGTGTVNKMIYGIVNKSRDDALGISTNNGVAWTYLNGTVDAHLHQYTGNESFWSFACANDTATTPNKGCSTERQTPFNLTLLPPSTFAITNPANGTYYGTINITWTPAMVSNPTYQNISNYSIFLAYPNETINQTLLSSTLNTSWNWSTLSNSTNGQWLIIVNATDNTSYQTLAFSELFYLDNTDVNISLYFNGVEGNNSKYEQGTPVNVSANSSFAANIWFDVNQTGMGTNYSGGASPFSFNISTNLSFKENMTNGNLSEYLNITTSRNATINFTMHKYDVINGTKFNISSSSFGTNNTFITINGTNDKIIYGQLKGTDVYLSFFNDTNTSKTLEFTAQGGRLLYVNLFKESTNITAFTFQITPLAYYSQDVSVSATNRTIFNGNDTNCLNGTLEYDILNITNSTVNLCPFNASNASTGWANITANYIYIVNSTINGSQRGYAGGAGGKATSGTCANTGEYSAGGTAGNGLGGGTNGTGGCGAATGAGGGGHGTTGGLGYSGVSGGSAYDTLPVDDMTQAHAGSGAGGGGGGHCAWYYGCCYGSGYAGTTGGNGSASLRLRSLYIGINNSNITLIGGNGGNGGDYQNGGGVPCTNGGAGGSGAGASGGQLIISTNTTDFNNTIFNLSGGAGGTALVSAGAYGNNGGVGSGGVFYLFYVNYTNDTFTLAGSDNTQLLFGGYPNNISVDVGMDGTTDFNWTGELNTTVQANISNTTVSNWLLTSNDCKMDKCPIPVSFTMATASKMTIDNLNVTYWVNPISLNRTLIEAWQNRSPEGWLNLSVGISTSNDSSAQTNINITGVNQSYYGTDNVTVKAYCFVTDKNCNNVTMSFMVYHSRFNKTIPGNATNIWFLPTEINYSGSLLNSSNVQAYAQNDTTPAYNISSQAYSSNFSTLLALNETLNTCVTLTASKNSNKSQGVVLTTGYKNLTNMTVYPNQTGIWMWADLVNCNWTTARTLRFKFNLTSCCDNCICVW